MDYRNEPCFPGDGGIVASGEARRATESAKYAAEIAGRRAIETEEMATKGLANANERITDVRWALSDLTSRIGDLEHQARVLFAQDETQIAEIEALKGQAGEAAAVIVGLAKRLEDTQGVQREMVECLVQVREALIAIAEHVASMETGSRDVLGVVEGILAEGLEGLHERGEEGGSVGLPWQTKEFIEAVDVLCIEFRAYDKEAKITFDYSVSPPTIRDEWRDEFSRSGIKEERQYFAEKVRGIINEQQFRDFLCTTNRGRGLVETNRIFYREYTKNNYNELVKKACDAILQNIQQEEAEVHPA